MCEAMVHRGPDDSGMASRGFATLGMRRLAIFDPLNGHQPMTTPDGRYTLVFNGAIYNHLELRPELESTGWAFRTRCDTEVLLAALATWGAKALPRLRGMFAFALWDGFENSLFAARDPFGIKPLYFAISEGRLVLASEVTALLRSGACTEDLDISSVADYLAWFAVPAPSTIYKGISSLQPGESLRFRAGKLEIGEYWSFRSISDGNAECRSRSQFVEGLREKLEDSIAAHVLADVPVGAFLSGGLDSAVIAGLMSRASGTALKTFTIGFEEDGFSEADEAEETARLFGAVHHTRILTGDEVARDLGSLLGACDQPSGDGVNTFYVSQTAHEAGVKAALSGLGGDELFGGYPSFRDIPKLSRALPHWRRLPAGLRTMVLRALGFGGIRSRKLSDFLEFASDAHELGALQRRVFSERSRLSILSNEAKAQLGDLSPWHPRLGALRADIGTDDVFSLVSAWEIRTYMADVLLRDSDAMSMRHSLELRVPFVDRPLLEWLWLQPAKFRDDPKNPKSALRDAVSDILPEGLKRRKKRGFTLPFPLWMRSHLRPFIEDTLSPESLGRSGLFQIEPVRRMWKAFLMSHDDREWSRIWSLAVLISFVNRPRASQPAVR